MKFLLQIFFLFLTWFPNQVNATPVFSKGALPIYELSFTNIENGNEESAVKIGVENFARSEITENEPQKPYLHLESFFKTFFSNSEKGNFSTLTFEKNLSKNQYSSFNFSKKEQLSLLENRAREVLVIYVQGAGNFAKYTKVDGWLKGI